MRQLVRVRVGDDLAVFGMVEQHVVADFGHQDEAQLTVGALMHDVGVLHASIVTRWRPFCGAGAPLPVATSDRRGCGVQEGARRAVTA